MDVAPKSRPRIPWLLVEGWILGVFVTAASPPAIQRGLLIAAGAVAAVMAFVWLVRFAAGSPHPSRSVDDPGTT